IGTLGGSAVKKFVRWIYHVVIATATFKAADQGQQDANSNLLYNGIVFYRADPTGKLGFLDNKIGLYVYWQDSSGNDWSNVWEWK
ncbi:MAG: hypothetical protein WA393_09910, partial [Nitrososphaeraceae archaeon]